MAKTSGKKLTKYVPATTVLTAEVANTLYGGLYGTTEGDAYEPGDPVIAGHIHDGLHKDGHAQKVDLVDHITGQLRNSNLADDAVTHRNVQGFLDQDAAIPEYQFIDGNKYYYLDLSDLRSELPASYGTGDKSAVVAGEDGIASGDKSVVVGGKDLQVTGTESVAIGGRINQVTGEKSASVGGELNIVSADLGFIGSGKSNTLSGAGKSIIGSGFQNTISSGEFVAILGGSGNSSTKSYTFIGGGDSNSTSEDYSVVSGGKSNTSSGLYSAVSGGKSNTSSGAYTIISGGLNNVNSSDYSVVAGGNLNTISSSSDYSVIGGGNFNSASANYSAILSGEANATSGIYSAVLSGNNNTITGTRGVIAGGQDNTISGNYSVIVGGEGNTIESGSVYSTVTGAYNKVTGDYSYAGGRGAVAINYGEANYSSGSFSLITSYQGDSQRVSAVWFGQTVGAVTSEIFLDKLSEKYVLRDFSTLSFTIEVAAMSSVYDAGGVKISGIIKRASGVGSTAIVGTPVVTVDSDAALVGITAAVSADIANGSLVLQVTGVAGKTIRWSASMSASLVRYV